MRIVSTADGNDLFVIVFIGTSDEALPVISSAEGRALFYF